MDRSRDAARFGALLLVTGVLIAWAVVFLAPQDRLPLDIADGAYASDCCGQVVLKGGEARAGQLAFQYVIDRDKQGPYILPIKRMVTADTSGLAVAEADTPLKL